MTAGTTPGRAAVADVRVRGTDRKLYSARRLTPEQRDRAIDAAHYLVCQKHMTIRAAQRPWPSGTASAAARAPSTPTSATTCASTVTTRT